MNHHQQANAFKTKLVEIYKFDNKGLFDDPRTIKTTSVRAFLGLRGRGRRRWEKGGREKGGAGGGGGRGGGEGGGVGRK